MTLRNLTREQVESATGHVLEVTEDAILMRCLDDYYIWALKDDISVTPNVMTHGHWEAWITSWFTRNIHEGDHVVDIGANCGYYTMLFERLVGNTGRVVAYEANPRYIDLLGRTLEANSATYEVRPYAVSDTVGTATLAFPGQYTGSASIVADFEPRYGPQQKITVQTTSLNYDYEYEKRYPNLIKMDVEGAEELVWRGARDLLTAPVAPVIVLEYTPKAYTKSFNNELFDYGIVTRIGYDGNEEPVTPQHLEGLTDWDMLVIRKGG